MASLVHSTKTYRFFLIATKQLGLLNLTKSLLLLWQKNCANSIKLSDFILLHSALLCFFYIANVVHTYDICYSLKINDKCYSERFIILKTNAKLIRIKTKKKVGI